MLKSTIKIFKKKSLPNICKGYLGDLLVSVLTSSHASTSSGKYRWLSQCIGEAVVVCEKDACEKSSKLAFNSLACSRSDRLCTVTFRDAEIAVAAEHRYMSE